MKILTNKKFQKIKKQIETKAQYDLMKQLVNIFIECETEQEFASKFYEFKNKFYEGIFKNG